MNRYDFTQPGGFPFDQGVMAFIQDCISTASQAATLAGPLAILSGCTVVGGNVTNGYVVINGEILPFTAGLIEDTVIIVQTGEVVAYQDGTPRTVKFTRIARFGSAGGVGEYNWADFKRNTTEGILTRIERCEGLLKPLLLSGKTWWTGSIDTIPAGFQEVAAMRGMFPMAAKAPVGGVRPDGFDIGDTGGAEGVKMKLENLIEHDHDFQKIQTQGSGVTSGYVYGAVQGTDTKKTQKTGAADPVPMNVLNPYLVGCWIEPIPGYFN